jgi:YcxB-like protein
MNEIKLRYSEPLLREAVRAFVFRAIIRGFGLRFFVACAALAFCIAYLLSHGDRSWVVGALASMLFFVGVFFLIIYLAHYRNTVGRFRQMRVPEASFAYTEEQFTLTSEMGSATLPWSAITEVWRYPRFWLILFSRSQFSTLPLDCLDAETQAFITRKTQRNEPNA